MTPTASHPRRELNHPDWEMTPSKSDSPPATNRPGGVPQPLRAAPARLCTPIRGAKRRRGHRANSHDRSMARTKPIRPHPPPPGMAPHHRAPPSNRPAAHPKDRGRPRRHPRTLRRRRPRDSRTDRMGLRHTPSTRPTAQRTTRNDRALLLRRPNTNRDRHARRRPTRHNQNTNRTRPTAPRRADRSSRPAPGCSTTSSFTGLMQTFALALVSPGAEANSSSLTTACPARRCPPPSGLAGHREELGYRHRRGSMPLTCDRGSDDRHPQAPAPEWWCPVRAEPVRSPSRPHLAANCECLRSRR